MIIAIDFDGTIVSHEYPSIGEPNPGALEVMRALIARGHKLILWTMRSGHELKEAVDYCTSNDVIFWGINNNPDQKSWTESPKQYANMYIDDAALGCPLSRHVLGRDWVDWSEVMYCLHKMRLIEYPIKFGD